MCPLQSSIVSSLAHALSRTSIPCRGFCLRRVDLAIVALGRSPVQGVHPSTKRCLLVAGHCLLAVGSAPLPGSRRLPRSSASTSRLRSSRRSLDLPRCDPALASLPLLRFPPLGSPLSMPGCPGPPMTLSRRSSQALTGRDRLRRIAVTGGGSPSPVCRPTRGSKPCTALRWCLGLLRVSTGGAETVGRRSRALSQSRGRRSRFTTPCGAACVSRAVALRGALLSRPTLRTVRTPCGARPIRSACSLGRVSVPGLGSSSRASTVSFA
jgi:hypothetical protein